jgi:DNA-3-methyladenine glycosylase II
LLATSDAEFRSAGVSRQKTTYLRDLAHRIEEGLLDFNSLPHDSDEDVISRLSAVKGVGRWTAQMFLMFQLQRLDVLPIGDVGVRRGMQVAYGLNGPPSEQQAHTMGQIWAPYRSIGSWYMWRAVEIIPPT